MDNLLPSQTINAITATWIRRTAASDEGLQETMEEPYNNLLGFMQRPAVAETLLDVLLCAVPIWVAVMIGWSWRPRWTGLLFLGLRSRMRFLWTAPPGFGARRFAFTALSAFSVFRRLWAQFKEKEDAAAATVQAPEGASVPRTASGIQLQRRPNEHSTQPPPPTMLRSPRLAMAVSSPPTLRHSTPKWSSSASTQVRLHGDEISINGAVRLPA